MARPGGASLDRATFLKSHLPTTGRVGALLAQIDELRGGDHASRGLTRLGLAQWHDRKLVTMSPRELRALELVVAVSTPAPAALVLTEPGADIAPLDRQGLRESLLEARAAGACVIVVTASMSDAVELTETLHLFERGRIVRWVPSDQMGALVPGRGIELRIEVDYPRLIVAPLTDDPDVTGIGWDQEGRKSVLSVRGEDVDRVALAVARAALATGTNVRAIAPVAPGLDEVRAAAAGLALAAYHAAYQAWYAHDARERAGTPAYDPTRGPTT